MRLLPAVLLGANGRLAGGPVVGYVAVADLMDDTAEQPAGGRSEG